MKNRILAGLMAIMIMAFFSGCRPDKDKSNFKLTLKSYVNGQPLNFSTIYNDGASKEFFFNGLKFYVSHVKLVREDGTETEVAAAGFFDYQDNNWKSLSGEIAAGTYKGIKFDVGLDAAQNLIDPDTKPASDPLGPKDDMYWEWLKHRFINIEGVADTLGTSFNVPTVGLAYHVGRNETLRSVSLTGSNFVIEEGKNKEVFLNLDLHKVFSEGPNAIDMFNMPGTQSENADLYIAEQFADQFATAFSYTE
jgi:hypothetical protein